MRGSENIGNAFLLSVGQAIAKKRKDAGMSMADLGEAIGADKTQIHRIENGYNITMTTLLKISLALGVKPDELVKFNARTKKEDLESLVDSNKSSKLSSSKKETKPSAKKVAQVKYVTDEDFLALRRKTKNKELQQALLALWEKLKETAAIQKGKAS